MAKKVSKAKQDDKLNIASFANNGYLYKIKQDELNYQKQKRIEQIIDKICISMIIVSAVLILWYGIQVVKLVVNAL